MALKSLSRNSGANLAVGDWTTLYASSLGVNNMGTVDNTDTAAFKLDDADRVVVVARVYTTRASSAAITGRLRVYAGDDRLAWQNSAVSDFDLEFEASSEEVMSAIGIGNLKTQVAGPFESAKFAVKSTTAPVGSPTLKVAYGSFVTTASSLTTASAGGDFRVANVAVFRLP